MLHKCCYTCKHWQGTKLSNCGSCHYIVGELMPQLFKEEDVFGWNFNLPFDPHDIKYFEYGREIMAEMRRADVPDDVHKMFTREDDIRFILDMYDGEVVRDSEGRPSIKGEREAKVSLVYFYTNKFKKGCFYYE